MILPPFLARWLGLRMKTIGAYSEKNARSASALDQLVLLMNVDLKLVQQTRHVTLILRVIMSSLYKYLELGNAIRGAEKLNQVGNVGRVGGEPEPEG